MTVQQQHTIHQIARRGEPIDRMIEYQDLIILLGPVGRHGWREGTTIYPDGRCRYFDGYGSRGTAGPGA
jgi:hypothetical protein